MPFRNILFLLILTSTMELGTFLPLPSNCIKTLLPSRFHRIAKSCSQAPIPPPSSNQWNPEQWQLEGHWSSLSPCMFPRLQWWRSWCFGVDFGEHGQYIMQDKVTAELLGDHRLCCELLYSPLVPAAVAGQVAPAGVDGFILPMARFSCHQAWTTAILSMVSPYSTARGDIRFRLLMLVWSNHINGSFGGISSRNDVTVFIRDGWVLFNVIGFANDKAQEQRGISPS